MWPSTEVKAVEKAAEAVCNLVEGAWSSAGYRGDDLGRRVKILEQDQRYWTKWKSFNFNFRRQFLMVLRGINVDVVARRGKLSAFHWYYHLPGQPGGRT